MHRIALTYVRTPAVAEEVVQDAWVGMLRSLPRFEGRSLAAHMAAEDPRQPRPQPRCARGALVPFSSLTDDEPSVAAERFRGTTIATPGTGSRCRRTGRRCPSIELLAQETLAFVDAAIRALPARQHEVMLLRDVEGWSSEEVCDALGLSGANQRVLLHRARSRVRESLETYLEPA